MSKTNTKATKQTEAKTESVNPIAEKYDLIDLMDEFKTKSAVIRKLAAEGFKTGEIAKFMNIRYQHARNVLVTPLKGQDKENGAASEPTTEETDK